jgi:hypothetical protein
VSIWGVTDVNTSPTETPIADGTTDGTDDWSEWTSDAAQAEAETAVAYAEAADAEIAENGETDYSDYLATEAVAHALSALGQEADAEATAAADANGVETEGGLPVVDDTAGWADVATQAADTTAQDVDDATGDDTALLEAQQEMASSAMAAEAASNMMEMQHETNMVIANNIGGYDTEFVEEDEY